jgi:hypothetical protein
MKLRPDACQGEGTYARGTPRPSASQRQSFLTSSHIGAHVGRQSNRGTRTPRVMDSLRSCAPEAERQVERGAEGSGAGRAAL